MNISRKAFVRPVAVVVLAAGLAGCGVFAQTESADEIGASRAAEAAASEVVVDEAVSGDDDDDDEDVGLVREPEVEESASSLAQLVNSAVPLASDWPGHFYDAYAPRGPNGVVTDVSPLIDFLPASSQLLVDDARLGAELQEVLRTPDTQSAVRIAQSSLLGFTLLVNDRVAEPFSSVAATTCVFCAHRLEAAYAVHDEDAELPARWEISLDDEARVVEVSGPHHLVVAFTGEDKGLIIKIEGHPIMLDIPARGIFQVEMLFDEGQWWVLEVTGPHLTKQPVMP